MTLQELKNLTPAELELIADKVFSLFKEQVESHISHDKNTIALKCPHCSSTKFVKYGFNKSKQRYLCRGCDKLFSNTTNTIIKILNLITTSLNLYRM